MSVRFKVYNYAVKTSSGGSSVVMTFNRGDDREMVGTITAPDGSEVKAVGTHVLRLVIPLGVARSVVMTAEEAVASSIVGDFGLDWGDEG